jgi:hypothetical protein
MESMKEGLLKRSSRSAASEPGLSSKRSWTTNSSMSVKSPESAAFTSVMRPAPTTTSVRTWRT